MNKTLLGVVKAVLFFVFLALVFTGQRHIGYSGSATMLAGLAGLIALLWDYNRKYQ